MKLYVRYFLLGLLTLSPAFCRAESEAVTHNFEDLDVSTVFYVQLDNPNDHSSVKIPITVTEQRNGDFYYE